MAQFRGTKNLQLGFDEKTLSPLISAKYDHETRDYVIEVDDEDADDFRKIARLYDFREVGVEVVQTPEPASPPAPPATPEPEPPHAPPAGDGEDDDEDTPDPEPSPDPQPTPGPTPEPKRGPGRPRKTQE